MKYKLLNIFQELLSPDYYEAVPNEAASHIVNWAANELYPKTILGYDKQRADLILQNKAKFLDKDFEFVFEYELDNYTSWMQFSGYCQTASMIHIYKNKLYQDLDYIGFFQYDMLPNISFLSSRLKDLDEKGDKDIIFTNLDLADTENTFFCCAPYLMIDDFNDYFGTEYSKNTFNEFKGYCHTWLLPIDVFNEMMEWIIYVANKVEHAEIKEHPEERERGYAFRRDKEWAGRAGIFERAHSLYLTHKIAHGSPHESMGFGHKWPTLKSKTLYGKGKIPKQDDETGMFFLSDFIDDPRYNKLAPRGEWNTEIPNGQSSLGNLKSIFDNYLKTLTPEACKNLKAQNRLDSDVEVELMEAKMNKCIRTGKRMNPDGTVYWKDL